ncbi:hypothetical protein [Hyalangium versicolor]|uniref:hypothetical protein n=1 Tax=Hyalangium versicolor TaxID=2861190 RepID=UPI001CC9551D|nr:hypothetical protein [Hyalangium versicolor]
MPDTYHIGSENELRQMKIECWRPDPTKGLVAGADIDYDDIFAVTHPQYRQLGLDLLTVAADHEKNNTAEIEVKIGPLKINTATWKAARQAQKLLAEVFVKLSGLVSQSSGAARRKSLANWTTVLLTYNTQLNQKAKTNAELKKFKLYELTALRDLLNTAQVPNAAHVAHVGNLLTQHGQNDDSGVFLKDSRQTTLTSGTQTSFEVPLVRLGKPGTAQKKGFENAFEKPPAKAIAPPNQANFFVFAREIAHETLAAILNLDITTAPNTTVKLSAHIAHTDDDKAEIAATLTIFGFNRFMGLGDGVNEFSGEKDKFGIVFKSAPNQLIANSLSAQASAILTAFRNHAQFGAVLAAMCRKYVDKHPSTRARADKQTLTDKLVGFARPILSGNLYTYTDGEGHQQQVNDCPSGKPLPARAVESGKLAIVAETRSSSHRFGALMAVSPRNAITEATVISEIAALQSV